MASETSLKHLTDKDDAHREDEARGNAGCSLEEASDDKRDPAETEWSDKTLQAKSFWKRRRERVKANLQETVKNLSEEQFRERKERRAVDEYWRRTPISELPLSLPRVAVDMGWANQLTEKEARSLGSQVSRICGSQKLQKKPLLVHLVGLRGMAEKVMRSHTGFPNWKVHRDDRPLLEVYADCKERLLFLSPDAPEPLSDAPLDPDTIFVIGGIVDRDRLKGASYGQCQKDGIRSARLPINESGALPPGMRMPNKSLNVNSVYDILCVFAHTNSWAQAISPHIPKRKGYILVPTSSSSSDSSSASDGKRQRTLQQPVDLSQASLPSPPSISSAGSS